MDVGSETGSCLQRREEECNLFRPDVDYPQFITCLNSMPCTCSVIRFQLGGLLS
jgi:hypothetical protein